MDRDNSCSKLLRIVTESSLTILLIAAGLFSIGMIEPARGGFFCNDRKLSYPFVEKETVDLAKLGVLILALPNGLILLTETYKQCKKAKRQRRRFIIFNCNIPSIIVCCYIYLGIFWFGLGVTEMFTKVAKYMSGQLRPNFFDMCKPIMPGNTTCADPINQNRYITEFVCHKSQKNHHLYADLSFPSGHTSSIFYVMMYLSIYLEVKWRTIFFRVAKVYLQFFFMLIAWYVALSRVKDHYHHFQDIFVGGLIGIFISIFVTMYLFKEFFYSPRKKMKQEAIMEQERSSAILSYSLNNKS